MFIKTRYIYGSKYFSNTFFGGNTAKLGKTLHVTSMYKFPQAAALKLPTNVVDINSSEMGRFSPLRERDLSGPVINTYGSQQDSYPMIDITVQSDPHVNKYDCRGAVSLSSSMQSNVPSPFSGNHTHLNMPGSQWGQGYKYLSDHLHSAHYLTLRNEYRARMYHTIVAAGMRKMSTQPPSLTTKEKLKVAFKEYGPTVIIFHIALSLLSLGVCYGIVCSGFDAIEMAKRTDVEVSTIAKIVTADHVGEILMAYAMHKAIAPVRVAVTLAITPLLVKYLRKTGVFKGYNKKNISGGGNTGSDKTC